MLDGHLLVFNDRYKFWSPIQVSARSEAWVCGHWLAETAGSNPSGDVCRECCVLSSREVLAIGRSLVQRSATECGVS